MDTARIALHHMASDEESMDTGKTNDKEGAGQRTSISQRNEWTSAMVECRGITYEPSVSDSLLQQIWISSFTNKTDKLLKPL